MAVIDPKNYGQIPSGLVPANLNQEAITGFGTHIKGSHDYPYLFAPASDPAKWNDNTDTPVLVSGEPIDPDYLPPYRNAPGLLDIHSNRMLENMTARVKIGFEILTVQLTRNPDFIAWRQILETNWNSYWQIINRMIPDNAQIVEFAEDYDGTISGWPDTPRPPYDDSAGTYPAEGEVLWETVEDPKRHRWYRIKYLSYDINDNPVVGDISPPIPRGENSTTFVKEVNYYIRNGVKGVDDLEASRPVKPETFVNGVPNNSPLSYTDSIPPTPTNQYLWVIRALKELSGNINTDLGWTIPAYLEEDLETVRYSALGTPDPNTIVGPTEDVATGSNNTDLVTAGWVQSVDFDRDVHFYIATRTGTSGAWSNWRVERIRGEDGSRDVIVYKLLPLTSDYDDATWQASNTPTGTDPSDDKWLEYVQQETLFLINFRSTATLYADGSFKRNWTAPTPFSSIDTYNDYISIHPDNTGVIDSTKFIDDTIIKSFVSGVETYDPEDLWLRSQLFKGQTNILINDPSKVITYQWNKIFDSGQFLITPTDLGTNRDIKVNNADVTGRAIFQVVMTMDDAPTYTEIADAIADGAISTQPIFTEEISIKDQVDGLDGRTLSATATQSTFLLDTVPNPDELIPSTIIIRAEVDNVDKNTIEWFYLNGSDPTSDTWVEILETTSNGTASPKYTYINTNNDLVLVGGDVTTATDIFTVVGLSDVYFKCVIPAIGSFTALEDWVMINQVPAGVLTQGEAAFDVHLENPYHQIRVDEQGDFIPTELSSIQTNIEVRKGTVIQPFASFTTTVINVSGILTDSNDVLIGNDGGNKHEITIDEANINWDNTKNSGIIELDVTLGTETKKVFIGLGTTLEPTGFTGLNIVSDRGTFTFDYSTNGRDPIILDAELTKQVAGSGNVDVAGYNYEWKVISGRYKTYTAGQVIASVVISTLTVDTADLDGSAQYQCAAYLTKTGQVYDPPFYTDSVRINDVPDSQTRILWNNNVYTTKPPKPINNWSTYSDNDAGVDTWYKVTNASAIWYSWSVDGGTTWSEAFLVSGIPGIDGTDGDDGTDGASGAAWLQGGSNPSAGLGSIGDWYLNITSYEIFEKTDSTTWTSRGNIKGNDGSTWSTGSSVPSGATGSIGDFYLRTGYNDIYEKTGSSTWVIITGFSRVQVGGSIWNLSTPRDGDLWIDKV